MKLLTFSRYLILYYLKSTRLWEIPWHFGFHWRVIQPLEFGVVTVGIRGYGFPLKELKY